MESLLSASMAELPRLGKHCAVANCHQLDFLPFECSGCSSIFCKDHRLPESHDCTQENIKKQHDEYSGPRSYTCDMSGCNNKELSRVICEACHKNFCLSHRHQVDHNCEKYQAPEAKMTKTAQHVQAIIDSKRDKPPGKKGGQGRKSKATAAKVALMKIKMKAVGDSGLPQSERVFLQVLLPSGGSQKSQPMFFSKKWSIGRIVDYAASAAKLQNNNNVSGAKKLRLFDDETGALYPTDQTLESFMGTDSGILNGGNAILEYVDEDTDKLGDLEKYLR